MEGFRWPTEKMGTEGAHNGDRRVFCTYHNEQGHYTAACQPYKLYLEELVRLGRMEEWIDRAKTPMGPPPAEDELEHIIQ